MNAKREKQQFIELIKLGMLVFMIFGAGFLTACMMEGRTK